MSELWEVLLSSDDPVYDDIGSVYVPNGSSHQRVIEAAKRRFSDAIAIRRSTGGKDHPWIKIGE